MREHITAYKDKLEKSICEYMCMPVNERTAAAVHEMFKTLRDVDEISEYTFTYEDAKRWTDYMENDDGTTGPHWAKSDTTAVAKAHGIQFEHVSECAWWAVMNMMYSDYCAVADKYGVGTVDFYVDMSKAFLFDKDGGKPMDKVSAYYRCIACGK